MSQALALQPSTSKLLLSGGKHIRGVFLSVFEDIGGRKALATWAKKSNDNQTKFYQMIARFAPREVEITADDSIENLIDRLDGKVIDAVAEEVRDSQPGTWSTHAIDATVEPPEAPQTPWRAAPSGLAVDVRR